MSLYLMMTYKATKQRLAAAHTAGRLTVRDGKYIFDLGQGVLADLLIGSLDLIADELAISVDDDFESERGRHDPAVLVAMIDALNAGLDERGDELLEALGVPLAIGSRPSAERLRADLADFKRFCEFGVANGLAFSHTCA